MGAMWNSLPPSEHELELAKKFQESLPKILTGDEARALEAKWLKEKAEERRQADKILTETVLDPVTGEKILPSDLATRTYERKAAAVFASLGKPGVPLTDDEMRLLKDRDDQRLAGLKRIRERNAITATRSVDLGKI